MRGLKKSSFFVSNAKSEGNARERHDSVREEIQGWEDI